MSGHSRDQHRDRGQAARKNSGRPATPAWTVTRGCFWVEGPVHRCIRHPSEVQKRYFWLVLNVCLGLAAPFGHRAVNHPANDMCATHSNCLDTLLSGARVLKLPVSRRREEDGRADPACGTSTQLGPRAAPLAGQGADETDGTQ